MDLNDTAYIIAKKTIDGENVHYSFVANHGILSQECAEFILMHEDLANKGYVALEINILSELDMSTETAVENSN